MFPPNSCYPSTPVPQNGTVFGGRESLTEIIKMKSYGWLLIHMTWVLIRRGNMGMQRGIQMFALRGKATGGQSAAAICETRRGAQEKPKLPPPLAWISNLQNCEIINVCVEVTL